MTALELEPYPVGDVVFSRMVFEADAGMLERWGERVEAAPRELTSFLTLVAGRDGADIAQLYTVYAGADTGAAIAALTPLLDSGRLLDQQAQLVPYHAVVAPQGGLHRGSTRPPAIRAGLVDHVTPELAGALVDLLPTAPFIQIRSVGGAVNDVDAMATAYAHRHQNFSVNAVGSTLEQLNPVLGRVRRAPHRRALPELQHRPAPGARRGGVPGRDPHAPA